MKRVISLAAVVALLACGTLVSAQQKPNFSGTWVGVSPANQVGQEERIVHDARSLTLNHGSEGGHGHRTVYNLDGTPSRQVMTSHGEEIVSISTASWKGDQLVIQRATQYPDGKKVDSTITFALNAQSELVMELIDIVDGTAQPAITVVSRKKS